MPRAFAAHLRHVGRVDPAADHGQVVLILDNAPGHRAAEIAAPLRDDLHLGFNRLPSYSPRLNRIERFRKKLRRRATHDRLLDTAADLRRSARNSPSDFQTVRGKVRPLVGPLSGNYESDTLAGLVNQNVGDGPCWPSAPPPVTVTSSHPF